MKKLSWILLAVAFFVLAYIGKLEEDDSISDKQYTYKNLSDTPSSNWIGRLIEITFDEYGGKSIRNKTKIIEVLSVETDDEGFKYFNVIDKTDYYLDAVYFFWFKNSSAPNIIKWREVRPFNSPHID